MHFLVRALVVALRAVPEFWVRRDGGPSWAGGEESLVAPEFQPGLGLEEKIWGGGVTQGLGKGGAVLPEAEAGYVFCNHSNRLALARTCFPRCR